MKKKNHSIMGFVMNLIDKNNNSIRLISVIKIGSKADQCSQLSTNKKRDGFPSRLIFFKQWMIKSEIIVLPILSINRICNACQPRLHFL